MIKNLVFIGAGRIAEAVVRELISSPSQSLREEVKLHFIGHKSTNPARDVIFPLKGLLKTYRTTLVANGKEANPKILVNDDSYYLDTDCLKDADMIIFTAALFPDLKTLNEAREKGLGREAQMTPNVPIIEYYAQEIKDKVAKDVPIFLTTNPVDVFCEYLRVLTEGNLIIGLGGGVDSIRFQILLAAALNLPVSEVKGMIGFLHNGQMRPIVNTIRIQGKSLADADVSDEIMQQVLTEVIDYGCRVSVDSQRYLEINAGDANTPGAVLSQAILSYLGNNKQVACYNFKGENDKTGWQQPLEISNSSILTHKVDYSEEERAFTKEVYDIITTAVEGELR